MKHLCQSVKIDEFSPICYVCCKILLHFLRTVIYIISYVCMYSFYPIYFCRYSFYHSHISHCHVGTFCFISPMRLFSSSNKNFSYQNIT